MTNKRWNYCGDINLECGGFYWQESGHLDHVYAVEVIPASDMGGPDNLFLVQHDGSIFIGDDTAKIKSALECCGWIADTSKATRADIVLAMNAYRGIEDGVCDWIAIGPIENDYYSGFAMPEITVQLRGNASLERFVRREYLGLSK